MHAREGKKQCEKSQYWQMATFMFSSNRNLFKRKDHQSNKQTIHQSSKHNDIQTT